MQFESKFPIILKDENRTFYCNVVPVENTSYSKFVTSDGLVAVLISNGYGDDWSANIESPTLKKQMILDHRIVSFVLSREFKTKFSNENVLCGQVTFEDFKDLIQYLIPEIGENFDHLKYKASGFSQLSVKFITEGKAFQIREYDGSEFIEFFDPSKYITP
jgi:hypothetical protein